MIRLMIEYITRFLFFSIRSLDDGTPVDEPVWQLREPGETTAVSEQPTPLEEESDPAKGTLRCVPQGIVSTRYLTSPTATPDSHIHVFRETTV